MRPKEVIETVVDALRSSDNLPDGVNFVGYEPNIETEAIKLPVLEVSIDGEVRLDEENTDFIGTIQDDNGNDVGRVFESLYQLTLEVNIWTAQGSAYDPRELGDAVYGTLYNYDSAGPAVTLNDEIWRVRVGDGETDDDLTTSPTLRRWSQELDIWSSEQFTTDEEYIVNVDVPDSGDFGDSNATGDIDNA